MILTWDELPQYRGLVAMADGSFDPLHPGHLAYLHAARALGAPLLVNICPDSYTAKKHPVLIPAKERAQILDALGIMSYVYVSDEPLAQVVHQLQPRYLVKGDDWRGRLVRLEDDCRAVGTQIVYTPTVTHSSSAILKRFQPDVQAFEALVLSQKPADKPWEPVTDYSFEGRLAVEGPHAQLIRDVLKPVSVLDVGCGFGHLVLMLFEAGVRNVQGCDSTPQDGHPWFFTFDITRDDLWPCQYDTVICREVLEHLTIRDISRAVSGLCALSSRLIYLTTRFSEGRHFLHFDTSDELDPTHISIMPQAWLRHLFVLEGFKRRADLETKLDWQQKGRCLVYERAA